jgi:hypothetical protein
MALTWSRTVIAGKANPYDFSAADGGISVGRIYRNDTGGFSKGSWFWTMNAFGPGVDRSRAQCTGLAETKEEAVTLVEKAWVACRS